MKITSQAVPLVGIAGQQARASLREGVVKVL
jgi:hypothetical protein